MNAPTPPEGTESVPFSPAPSLHDLQTPRPLPVGRWLTLSGVFIVLFLVSSIFGVVIDSDQSGDDGTGAGGLIFLSLCPLAIGIGLAIVGSIVWIVQYARRRTEPPPPAPTKPPGRTRVIAGAILLLISVGGYLAVGGLFERPYHRGLDVVDFGILLLPIFAVGVTLLVMGATSWMRHLYRQAAVRAS